MVLAHNNLNTWIAADLHPHYYGWTWYRSIIIGIPYTYPRGYVSEFTLTHHPIRWLYLHETATFLFFFQILFIYNKYYIIFGNYQTIFENIFYPSKIKNWRKQILLSWNIFMHNIFFLFFLLTTKISSYFYSYFCIDLL